MIKNIIFDLGGVLIDWNPRYVFHEYFATSDSMEYFLNHICSWEWNELQDKGRSMADATEERIQLFPEYENEIRAYYGRWTDMLGTQIADTVDILKIYSDHPDYRIVALTNWSAETFPIALERFDFLQWFEGILVSGAEKMIKPDAEIYHLILDRYNLEAGQSVFIDDNPKNVLGAQEVGIHAIHFKSPSQLKEDLQGLLEIN